MIYLSIAFSIVSTLLLMGLIAVVWWPTRNTTKLAAAPWIIAWLTLGLVWNFFSGWIPVVLKKLTLLAPGSTMLVESISVGLVLVYSLSSLLVGFMIACNAASLLGDKLKAGPLFAFLQKTHSSQNILGFVLLLLQVVPAFVFVLPKLFAKS